MSVALAPSVKKAAKLRPSGLHKAEHARVPYRIYPSATETYEEILEPIYWHHNASLLRPGDLIEVFPEDRSYFAMLIVVAAEDNTAKVEEAIPRRVFAEPASETVEIPAGYAIDWRGPNGKFAVIRTADKHVIQSGFVKKDEALTWLISNRRTLVS